VFVGIDSILAKLLFYAISHGFRLGELNIFLADCCSLSSRHGRLAPGSVSPAVDGWLW